jgi:hypothetical protein
LGGFESFIHKPMSADVLAIKADSETQDTQLGPFVLDGRRVSSIDVGALGIQPALR